MFWASVLQGLLTLGHWQVWLAISFYVIAYFFFLYAVGAASGESGGRQAVGCLTVMFGGPVLQGVLMGILVAYLLPIMLGGSETTPLSGIAQDLGQIAKVGIVAVVVSIILTFVPIIGTLVSESVGIMTFVMGWIIFTLFSADTLNDMLSKAGHAGANVFPSLWLSIGYLAIASGLVQGAKVGLVYGLSKLEMELQGTVVILANLLAILAGLIPLFMYTQYVGMSVRSVLAQ